jgi:predicted anti-sigma-YlaC factor YlaD
MSMNSHLTHEELIDKLLGASSLTVNTHLLECSACAHELERLKGSIASFRDAAQAWGEDNAVTVERNRARTPSPARWAAASWVLVAAALILFAGGSAVYIYQQHLAGLATSAKVSATAGNPALSPSQLDQDNQLLSQVSGELSESVPAAMQPLLVSESTSSDKVSSK